MSTTHEITITLPGGRRVDAQVGPHTLHTDQPRSNGGTDTAPTPFELFLASLGTCAGIFVQGFCAARQISTDGVRIIERPSFDDDGTLRRIELELQLPPGFPEKYQAALTTVIAQCSVKRAIAAQPTIEVRAVAAASAA